MTTDSVATVNDERAAEALLDRYGTTAMVRAVALRAEELRFLHSDRAVGIAKAAIKAFGRLPAKLQSASLATLTWSIYGSALRNVARLGEAEVALMTAARKVSRSNLQACADIARRLASLRADQRRPDAVKSLLPVFLEWGRREGGRAYGEELVGAGAILIKVSDFDSAASLTEESLKYLPANGDSYYLSAIYNLANCRLELGATEADFLTGLKLLKEASTYVKAGTYPELRLHWLSGKYLRRLGRLEESLTSLETAREGIEARADGMDQALLMIDLAELHLERGCPEVARHLALSSFPILKLLRTAPEAYRALQTFHRAAQDEALDSAALSAIRDRLGTS